MDIEFFRQYCLQKKGAEESMPFGPDTLVFKVANKMFALTGFENVPPRANLKCNPEMAVQLRVEFPGDVIPGYHMNKKHWNTVYLEGNIPDSLIVEWIDHSYQLIIENLSIKEKKRWDL